MSIDRLHEKIRKLKNPAMMELGFRPDGIPPHILEAAGEPATAYFRFCQELLEGLQGIIPAVRFGFDDFALLGDQGITALNRLLTLAGELGYYVVLDGPQILSPWGADRAAERIFGGTEFPCDAMVISPYIGTDAIKPFLPYCREQGKALFVVVRSANKSASDLQDLYTGSRLVHSAAADIANRLGETILDRCAYSRVGSVVSAGAPNAIRTVRNAYKGMFLLVDGLDYPSGNYKNCASAFDRFGHGAVVCAGPSLTDAWRDGTSDGTDYIALARQAAERMKKNLSRYVTVL